MWVNLKKNDMPSVNLLMLQLNLAIELNQVSKLKLESGKWYVIKEVPSKLMPKRAQAST